MTRETKVGLVVAVSFLSLVGVVVAARMKRSAEAAPTNSGAQVITPNNAFAAAPPKKDAKKPDAAKNPPAVVQANLNEPFPGSAPPAANPADKFASGPVGPSTVAPPLGPETSLPPGLPLAELPKVDPNKNVFNPDAEQQKILQAIKSAAVNPDQTQFPGKPMNEKPLTAPPPVQNFGAPVAVAQAKKDPEPQFGVKPPDLPPPPADTHFPQAKDPIKPPDLSPPGNAFSSPKNDAGKPPDAPPPPIGFGAPAAKKDNGPAFGQPNPMDNQGKPQPGNPPPLGDPLLGTKPPAQDPFGQTAVKPPEPKPAADPFAPVPPVHDAKPTIGKPNGFQPPVKEPTNPNLPALGAETRNPTAPVNVPFNSDPRATPTVGNPPNSSPFGQAPAGSTAVGAAPFGGAPQGNLPQVKEFTPKTYLCKPEDTSFEAVSTRVYGSPKYASALQAYNRTHPLAKDNVQQDNPRLMLNQAVFVPPPSYLEDRYPQLVDNRPAGSTPPGFAPAATAPAATAPAATAPAATAPAGVPPAAGGNFAAVSIAAPVNSNPGTAVRLPTISGPTTDATKSYRVPPQGQMFLEIAQQTLGDRGRWSDIYRLNPTLRPEYPVPGGTQIRLPADARVP